MKPLLIALTVIVLGGLGYVGYSKLRSDPKSLAMELPISPTPTAQTSSKKISFSELVKQGGSYECTVKQAVSDMESDGVVFMDRNRLHGEFSNITKGVKIDTRMIAKDGYTYMWSSMAPESGFKIQLEVKKEDMYVATSSIYSWNMDQIGDYYCKDWKVDESKFTLPSGVTFVEMKK